MQRARGCARSGQDDVGGERDQFRCVFASAGSVRSPASIDARVAAVGPAQLLQSLYERRVARLPFRIVRGQVHEHADATNPIGLLRPRRERPCDCRRAAEQRDQLAAFHSITSSARAMKVGGMLRPIAAAALRLMISSKSVASWIGRSAGLAPLRMRST